MTVEYLEEILRVVKNTNLGYEHTVTFRTPHQLTDILELSLWALKDAKPALQWIDKPDHYEPDKYTQTACFQHRAYNALKELPKEFQDKNGCDPDIG